MTISHDTITKSKQTKKRIQWWENKPDIAHIGKPIEEMINVERLCLDGMEWARDCKRAVKMKQFFNLKGIKERYWTNLIQNGNESVINANEFMVSELGNRRELNMLEGHYKENSNMYMMHNYDNDWDKANVYHNDLKKQVGDGNKQTFVVIEKTPETDIVPAKKI